MRRCSGDRAQFDRGFTLVELLVALSVILVLASLLGAALGRAGKSSKQAVALSNMRQIGAAISLYAADKGVVPGPLWPGQVPLLDPARSGRLVRELAPYLKVPIPGQPTVVGLFVPPAYPGAPGAPALSDARTFVMNMAVPVEGGIVNPSGSLADAAPGAAKPLAGLTGNVWAFSDADRLHPRVAGSSWQASTPLGPIHSPSRLAFYFDGHAGGVSDAELDSPPSQ